MEQAKKRIGSASRTRSIAFVGLSIALMAVSAWVSIPLGPVPFTLQTFVMVFAFLVLTPRECVAAIAGYLALGAIGLPVFAGMRGGIGALAGPTGGFLWGFLLGAGVALLFLLAVRPMIQSYIDGKAAAEGQEALSAGRVRMIHFAVDLIAGFLFLAVTYLCGWAQLMAVASLSPFAAFAAAIAPFLILDAIKLVAAVATAGAVRKALR